MISERQLHLNLEGQCSPGLQVGYKSLPYEEADRDRWTKARQAAKTGGAVVMQQRVHR